MALATALVGGVTFGISGCVAHAVAGGARALLTVVGMLVISCFTIVGVKFGLYYKKIFLAMWVGACLTIVAALGFYVISSALGEEATELAGGIMGAVMMGVTGGFAFGFSISTAHGQAVKWVEVLGLSGAYGLAGLIAGFMVWGGKHGAVFGLSLVVTFFICILRAYYFLIHAAFLWPFRGAHLSRHPAAWDEMCSVPFAGLDLLLVSYYEREPHLATREIDRLYKGTAQREQAVRARIRIVAQKARACSNLVDLARIADDLPEEKYELQSMVTEIGLGQLVRVVPFLC